LKKRKRRNIYYGYSVQLNPGFSPDQSIVSAPWSITWALLFYPCRGKTQNWFFPIHYITSPLCPAQVT